MRTVVSAGDEVLIPSPCYVSYAPAVLLSGGIPVAVNARAEDGFKLTDVYKRQGKEAKGFVSLLDADTSEIRGYILTMTEEQEKKKEGYLKVIRSLLTAVIIKMFRLCAEREHAPLPSFQRKLVGEVIDYIYAHDTKELSVGGISRAMFFSPSYLSRLDVYKRQE